MQAKDGVLILCSVTSAFFLKDGAPHLDPALNLPVPVLPVTLCLQLAQVIFAELLVLQAASSAAPILQSPADLL